MKLRNFKTKILVVTASAAIIAGAGLAVAAEPEIRRVIVMDDGDGGKPCDMPRFAGPPPAFADIDSDHNGSLSQAEFDAFHKDHHPGELGKDGRAPPRAGCDVKVMGPPLSGGHGPGAPGERRRVIMMQPDGVDADKDGKVTFAEFAAPMKRDFDDLDANHDGVLTGDELPQRGPPDQPPLRN